MADSMQFDLVSPERRLASTQVREVRLPAVDGDMTAMPGHMTTIVNLRPGVVTVIDGKGTATEYAVSGGFAEIGPDNVTLLAERSHAREDMTQDHFDAMVADVRRKKRAAEAQKAGDGAVEAAVKLLADMEAMGTHMGLDPNSSTVPD